MPSAQYGGAHGGGHRLGHGHVQVPHLHPAGHGHRQPHGPDRQREAGGPGAGHLLRQLRGRQDRRGHAENGLQGVPHRRAQPGGEPDHHHGLRPAAGAEGGVHRHHDRHPAEAGAEHRGADDHRRAAGGDAASLRGRRGHHPAAFGIRGEENCAFLPKIMSRKKQVIPMLSALWG